MQPETVFAPAAKAVMGSSSPAAGKPARPFMTSAGPEAVLPSGICYGRDTMLSSSSLGDSVSQRGEAIGSFTPRGEMDFGRRDGHATRRMTLFPGGREIAGSKQLDTPWRPPAGLPLLGSSGSAVSCNSSFSGAGSVSHGSNYAEASAAASYYKQRQQQHSSCIFGDNVDSVSSVAGSFPADQATESDFRPQQRGMILQDANSVRSGKEQTSPQVVLDRLRPAGVPTAAWHSPFEQPQEQGNLLRTLETPDQQSQHGRQGTRAFSVVAAPQLQNVQTCVRETPRLQIGYFQPKHQNPEQHIGQACPSPQQEAMSVQEWHDGNSEGPASSRGRIPAAVLPSEHISSTEDSTRRQQQQARGDMCNNASMQEGLEHSAPESPGCKALDTQPLNFQSSPEEFVHPPEGSTASSNDYSASPASPSTPLPDEQEVEMERRHPQEHHSLYQHQLHTAVEETVSQRNNQAIPRNQEMADKSPMGEAFTCGASPSLGSPRSSRARWQPRPEEEDCSSTLRRNRDGLVSTRGTRNFDISSFVPREDPRSSREKQIQALRSTGSVMPVSAVADAAVAAASAAASSRYHGNTTSARGMADGSASDKGCLGSRNDVPRAAGQRLLDAHTALYPLSLMGRDTEQKDAGRRGTLRAGCPRLLPLDIAWHSSAASVLGNREALAQGSGSGGAVCSPTSNGSPDISSPAQSHYSHGQQLTARQRLLHQHCTSSVFAGEGKEGTTGDATARSLRSRPPSSLGGANPSRLTPLQKSEYGTKDEILQRRTDQLQNPWYSDLFGRHTPKRSPTASRCGVAAAIAQSTDLETTAEREGEDIQGGASTPASSPATGNAISGVDGATLDKICAHRRKTQLLQAPNAYERFINAMQSDICSGFGDEEKAPAQQHLTRAHLAKETLLQEKSREQRRRQRLQEAVKDGQGKYFHMATSEEARVGEMGKDLDFLGMQRRRAYPVKRNITELHLFGVGPDMTEEDIEKLCRTEGREKSDRSEHFLEPASATTITGQPENGAKSSKTGLSKYYMQVKLATDILTSKCKGTGKILLQYQEDEVDVEQLVRRLRDANVGVRQL